ncbi:MAG: PAS domain-containing protein [Planctomycetes bacterium]|nr:PAS domain-containing protein [Planctomycetota bacterium]
MRVSFFWRLYIGCVALILLSTVTLGVWFERRARADMLSDLDASLRARLVLLQDIAASHWDKPASPELELRIQRLGIDGAARLTLVRADGVVIADSERDPVSIGNHRLRPEIEQALRTGEGWAERDSETVGRPYRYLARAVRVDGELAGFVRAAFPLDELEARISDLRVSATLTALVAASIAVVVALSFARRVSGPLSATAALAERVARGDYAGPTESVEGADEIARLSEAIATMNRQLEERLATKTADRNQVLAILGGMVEGVVAIDADERIVHINGVAARLLGADQAAVEGRRIWEITRVREVGDLLDHARRTGEPRSASCTLVPSVGALGAQVELELRASAIRHAPGERCGAVLVMHDVTELRRLESVRRDFVANVSHELKTPLTAIRGMVETMIDDPLMPTEMRARFLERVREQSLRLSALVTDLLSLAKLETQEGRGERVPIDLRALVRDGVARFGDVAARKRLTLVAELPEQDCAVQADEESLRQILDNLLDNACKYTPEGGRVWARVLRRPEELRIEVEDSGIGIEPALQARVFERFYRVDKARSRDLGGTGLGLSIVKHLANSLGGGVSLESTPGSGSIFRVHFPI